MRLLLMILLFGSLGCSRSGNRVVLYCSQDQEFAEELLKDFQQRESVEVATKFDTEANKSVSLFEDLRREADRPRCGVYWNNEIVNTIRLKKLGLLEPFPESSESHFHSFAARARILIINTEKVPATDWPRSILDLTAAKWKGRVVMARPEFGTTSTHAACLADVLGIEAAKQYYRDLGANLKIVPGNKQVAQQVANGSFDIGFTDTDDALIELKQGKPVALIFPDIEPNAKFPRMGTLYIPNTLCLIRGSPNQAASRKLLRFLMEPGTEGRLAEGSGFQIPLNPAVKANLAKELIRPENGRAMQVDFEHAAELMEEMRQFLRAEIRD